MKARRLTPQSVVDNLELKLKNANGVQDLCRVMLLLETMDECMRFFHDLFTPFEIRSMAERWLTACLLYTKDLSYRGICRRTKISIATITRVARFLCYENIKGYEERLKILFPEWTKEESTEEWIKRDDEVLSQDDDGRGWSENCPKVKDIIENRVQNLYRAILSLETVIDCIKFLTDLCTPTEIESIAKRWQVILLLNKKKYSYNEIHNKTLVSIATITRIARSLFDDCYGGYADMLKKCNEKGLVFDIECDDVNKDSCKAEVSSVPPLVVLDCYCVAVCKCVYCVYPI